MSEVAGRAGWVAGPPGRGCRARGLGLVSASSPSPGPSEGCRVPAPSPRAGGRVTCQPFLPTALCRKLQAAGVGVLGPLRGGTPGSRAVARNTHAHPAFPSEPTDEYLIGDSI